MTLRSSGTPSTLEKKACAGYARACINAHRRPSKGAYNRRRNQHRGKRERSEQEHGGSKKLMIEYRRSTL